MYGVNKLNLVFGSPPRLWGIFNGTNPSTVDKRFTPTPVGNMFGQHIKVINPLRFTPTPVGNISGWALTMKKPAVHPHACGEYVRAWFLKPPSIRFTPTPVGNIHLAAGGRCQ